MLLALMQWHIKRFAYTSSPCHQMYISQQPDSYSVRLYAWDMSSSLYITGLEES